MVTEEQAIDIVREYSHGLFNIENSEEYDDAYVFYPKKGLLIPAIYVMKKDGKVGPYNPIMFIKKKKVE